MIEQRRPLSSTSLSSLGGAEVEFRQLKYFVTLAEELHFGRAASREHIVQSALSQQIQRLERELGTALVERNTHHVRLTAAGDGLLIEARQILDHVERAKSMTRTAVATNAIITVAVGDASLDTMPQVLHALRDTHPHLEVHQVEASVPEQYRMLADGRLDVGIGRAAHAPASVASEVVRLDPLGVLVGISHRFVHRQSIPVALLKGDSLLFADHDWAPQFNEFVDELCRSAGFTPTAYPGTVQSVRGAVELIREGRCVACVPRSCRPTPGGTRWLPLVEPAPYYPWSLLWRASDQRPATGCVLRCARGLSARLSWMDAAGDETVATMPE
jgi:DNA-binding transcriptional LysR family regulator